MRSILKTVAIGTLLLAQGITVPALAQRVEAKFDTGMIPSPHILMPQGEVKASV